MKNKFYKRSNCRLCLSEKIELVLRIMPAKYSCFSQPINMSMISLGSLLDPYTNRIDA